MSHRSRRPANETKIFHWPCTRCTYPLNQVFVFSICVFFRAIRPRLSLFATYQIPTQPNCTKNLADLLPRTGCFELVYPTFFGLCPSREATHIALRRATTGRNPLGRRYHLHGRYHMIKFNEPSTRLLLNLPWMRFAVARIILSPLQPRPL